MTRFTPSTDAPCLISWQILRQCWEGVLETAAGPSTTRLRARRQISLHSRRRWRCGFVRAHFQAPHRERVGLLRIGWLERGDLHGGGNPTV